MKLFNKPLTIQLYLYLALGLIGLCIDVGVFILLSSWTKEFTPALFNATVSCVAAVLFNYYVSYKFIFLPAQRSRLSQTIRFGCVVLLGIFWHDLSFWFGNHYLSLSPLFAKLFAVPIGTIWNFWARRTLVFSKKIPTITQKLFNSFDS